MASFTVVLLLVVASASLAVRVIPSSIDREGKACVPLLAKAACTHILNRAEQVLGHREYEKYYDLFEDEADYEVKGTNYKGKEILKFYADMLSAHPVRDIMYMLKSWDQSETPQLAKCFLSHKATLFSKNFNAEYVYFLRQGDDCAYRIYRVEQD
ncbi:unnamed protein product [Caenorhabditis auriculariae]|uniref:Uncharacterized protein n=1 Tax=Caenorhabditis auriculariae TaxID=2777116 RepID=A0A8S1HVM3_9PELO|nr:unnamed protein product [Caenorhabditis auriculariae]